MQANSRFKKYFIKYEKGVDIFYISWYNIFRKLKREETKMTLKTLKNLIEKQGATLNKDGKAVDFSNGFQVSKKDCFILELKNINEILNKINGLFKSLKPGEFLGLWVENQKIYVDISIKINNLKSALNFGKMQNQISIFDWSTKNCIYL